MDKGSTAGAFTPAAAPKTFASAGTDEDFECVFDVPYITVNRIEGRYLAEVVLSDDETTSLDRIETALAVGREHGVHAYARIHGDYGTVLIHFTDDLEDLLDDND